MNISRRWTVAGLALSLCAMTAGPALAQAQQPGRTAVHVVVQPEPPMLMQGLNQNGPTKMVAGNIYESLLRYDEKLHAAALARRELGDLRRTRRSTPSSSRRA